MESRPSDLTGKVILVTGGAKRIGRGIALALAERGARVLIHYGASAEEARKTSAECWCRSTSPSKHSSAA